MVIIYFINIIFQIHTLYIINIYIYIIDKYLSLIKLKLNIDQSIYKIDKEDYFEWKIQDLTRLYSDKKILYSPNFRIGNSIWLIFNRKNNIKFYTIYYIKI